jgi:hypothetical protein
MKLGDLNFQKLGQEGVLLKKNRPPIPHGIRRVVQVNFRGTVDTKLVYHFYRNIFTSSCSRLGIWDVPLRSF